MSNFEQLPLLVGLLVDVSGSMTSSIANESNENMTRLEGFREGLEKLVKRAASTIKEQPVPQATIRLFAYGFGFGNLFAQMLGRRGDRVRDLLDIGREEGSTTIDVIQLADNWPKYRAHVEGMAMEMFGDTPMLAGFQTVKDRLSRELTAYPGLSVLFVLSDGDPNPDDSLSDIEELANNIKMLGTTIVSCYVTSNDLTEPRHVYGAVHPTWPSGARLMFSCSSSLPPDSPFGSQLREYGWTVEAGGRLFTQVNQSELLSEFMSVVLSPLQAREPRPQSPLQRETDGHAEVSQHKTQIDNGRTSANPETLILFVHGLGGAVQKTWGRFPALITADRDLARRFDIAFYSYPTTILRLPFFANAPKIQDLAAGLKNQINNRYAQWKDIVLICHSLGGLVARKYLLDEVRTGSSLRVSKIVLLAVPNNGAGLAEIAQFISWRNPQLKQLCRSADIIEFVNEDWVTSKMTEKVRVRFIVGTQDRVVDRYSARAYWGNPDVETIIGKGHIDIVKPTNENDDVYVTVKRFLLEG